jgi:hypothetical protein
MTDRKARLIPVPQVIRFLPVLHTASDDVLSAKDIFHMEA